MAKSIFKLFILLCITICAAIYCFALEGPCIKMNRYVYDFGKIEKGETRDEIFMLENIGDEELIIDDINSSATYILAKVNSKYISPKGRTLLSVYFDSKERPVGDEAAYITIFSNDSSEPRRNIPLYATVIPDDKSYNLVAKVPRINSQELYSKIEKGENIVILDVRDKNSFLSRHIPKAVSFPRDLFESGSEKTESILNGINKDSSIVVVYCGIGYHSSYAAYKLIVRGFRAFSLDGISYWTNSGYPLESGAVNKY